MKKVILVLALFAIGCSDKPTNANEDRMPPQMSMPPEAPAFKKALYLKNYQGVIVKHVYALNDSIGVVTLIKGDSVLTEYWSRGLIEGLEPGDRIGKQELMDKVTGFNELQRFADSLHETDPITLPIHK
jgi:hypothetical protein